MAEAIVSDWIAEFNSLEPEEVKTFAALHAENHELSAAIYSIFNDKSKHSEYLHQICIQLYNFYRSSQSELKCFALQFIPSMIYLYLNAVATGEKQNVRSVETLILCAYNIEVCSDEGVLKSVSFRIPVLAQASIYHEEKNLQASDLKRWEDHCNKEISWKPTDQITKITAQNRLQVMAALMFVFNQQLSLIQKSALYHLCKMSSKLSTQGFTRSGHSYRSSYGTDPTSNSSMSPPNVIKQIPRIPLSQQLLIELLHAIYFAMFNEFASAATQALDDIHTRASYELYPDVILVTNAIRNSLQANPSGQPCDGPMGISVALTPSTNVVTVSKSMITNASFRTKKLPDDLELENLKHLQLTQDEMERILSIIDEDSPKTNTPRSSRKICEGLTPTNSSKRNRWKKNWGWKQSPGKSSSIEEEPTGLLTSPKKSQSLHTTSPHHSPKQRNTVKSSESINDESTSPIRHRKRKSEKTKHTETRSSAGARLFQMLDNNDERLEVLLDEFGELSLNNNCRPASIHVTQKSNDEF